MKKTKKTGVLLNLLKQKTLKITISTSVWGAGAQHPNAGQNIQHLVVLQGNIGFRHYTENKKAQDGEKDKKERNPILRKNFLPNAFQNGFFFFCHCIFF